jgi:tetratricopeptide (TPR) repeat protein
MAIVWPDRVIGDETLKQRIKLLRKSLGDDASSPVYIEAVRGRGYRLIPQVKSECVIKQPPSVMLDLSANDRFPSISGTQLGSVWRKTSAIGLIIFLIIVISSRFVPSSSEEQELLSAKLSEEQGSTQQASLNNSGQVQLSNIEDANRYYVRGRDYYHRYRKEDNNIAIDLFRRSIAIDSSYSPAYAALSQAFSQKYFQFSGDEEDKQLAIDNAYQALSYDNKSAAAYKALGTAYYVAGWLSKSINILTRGLRIDPSDPEITINLAYIYSEQGNLEKALLLQKSVLKKMPDHAVAMLHVGLTLQRAGKYSDARY